MEVKDVVTLVGIALTFLVACFNLVYSITNSRKTIYVNTVTTSRTKWIDSLRDKVSLFIAVTTRLRNPVKVETDWDNINALLLQRETLLHQVILHLNPTDTEDKEIADLVKQIHSLTPNSQSKEIGALIVKLRDATGAYIKKEWEKVKREAKSGEVGAKD
jgi:hypothetical protein